MDTTITIPKGVRNFFIEVGEMSFFAGRFFKEAIKPPFEFKELTETVLPNGEPVIRYSFLLQVL